MTRRILLDALNRCHSCESVTGALRSLSVARSRQLSSVFASDSNFRIRCHNNNGWKQRGFNGRATSVHVTMLSQRRPLMRNISSAREPEPQLHKQTRTTSTSPESILSKNAKKTNSSDSDHRTDSLLVLQLRNIHPKDTLEEHFDIIARRTELTKFKWMDTLRDKLQAAADHKGDDQNDSKDTLWKTTKSFLATKKKTIPTYVQDSFWNLLIAPTTEKSNFKKKRKKGTPSTSASARDVYLLEKAREVAAYQPFLWSHSDKHNLSRRLKEAGSTQSLQQHMIKRAECLKDAHLTGKTTDIRRAEAKAFADFLRSNLPPAYYKRYIRSMEDICKDNKIPTTPPAKNKDQEVPKAPKSGEADKTPLLYTRTRQCLKTHLHLVGQEVADFFFVTVRMEPDDADAIQDQNVVTSDTRVVQLEKEWEDARQHFVQTFTQIQTLLVEENEKIREQNPSKMSTYAYDDSEESIMTTFYDAKKNPGSDQKSQTVEPKMMNRTYVAFEAIPTSSMSSMILDKTNDLEEKLRVSQVLDSKSAVSGSGVFSDTSVSDRLLFLDNLPIDISKARLLEAYGRCGSIADIQIFNQRPDLDPGRKLEDSKKKIRKASASTSTQGRGKWERPRTPVYAMILFESSDGAKKATVDALRIFGMVLDKHLIRSIPPTKLTNLYLEDTPLHHDATSIEYELSQVLHPELYVCLDLGNNQRLQRQSARSGPRSTTNYELKFPSFEAAYWAYLKLSTELEFFGGQKEEDARICNGENSSKACLHWMKTPRDAMYYWTRHLNY